MEKWICLAGILATSGLWSEAEEMRLSAIEQKLEKGCWQGICAEKGTHLFASVDAFVWKMHEEASIAIRTKNPFTGGLVQNFEPFLKHGHGKRIAFEWDPGFRVGLGYHTPHEKIDISLTWLRFFTHGHRNLHAGKAHQLSATQLDPLDNTENLSGSQFDTEFISFGHVKGKLWAHLNQLDLNVSRPFCIGSWFSVRPHVGLRTTWLEQRLFIDYLDTLASGGCCVAPGDDFGVRKKCSWWGIGPEVGVDLRCFVGYGITFFGNIAGAIEWGFHNTHDKEIDISEANLGHDSVVVDVHDHYRMSHPIFDLQLGMGWGYFFGKKLHLQIDAMWEHHVYFSQNRFPYFVSDFALGVFRDEQGDKTFEGWTLSTRLDF